MKIQGYQKRALLALFLVAILLGYLLYIIKQLSDVTYKLEKFYIPVSTHLYTASINHTKAHLWLEEFLSGDQTLNIESIYEYYDSITSDLAKTSKLIHELNEHHATNTFTQLSTIERLHQELDGLMRQRIFNHKDSAAGSIYDARFDEDFTQLIEAISSFSNDINHNIAMTMEIIGSYKMKLLIILLIVALSTAMLVKAYLRYQKTYQDTLQSKVNEQTNALQNALVKAEDSAKAKSEFLANMSHEIRTPLNAITGFTDLLAQKRLDDESSLFIKQIKNGSKTLMTIINDILDLSKIEAGKMTITKSETVLMDLLDEMKALFGLKAKEKGIEFVLKVDSSLPEVIIVDEARVRQVLINLLSNAMKFTQEGSVTLGVKMLKNSDTHVDLSFYVADTGLGIAKEDHQRLFEAFTQKEGQDNRRYGGTGLGLAICQKLATLMEGTLMLESELGSGSRFTLLLQNIETAERKEEEDAIVPVSTKHFTGKVLLVEDIMPNRLLVRMLLDDSNVVVEEAENGLEALAHLEIFTPDLILMDIQMPVMDGFTATRKIRENPKWRDIPIVALTASVMKEEVDHILEQDFNGYLQKPIENDKFFEVIARYMKVDDSCSDEV